MLKNIFIFSCLSIQLITLISLSGSLISPKHFALSDLIYFAFPYLFFPAILSALIVIFLSRKTHFKMASGLMVFLFLLQSRFFISFTFSESSIKHNDKTIKTISYNVNNFGLYSWDMNITIRDSIMAFIHSENPDIIFFQDFFTTYQGSLNNIDFLKNELKYEHFVFSPTLTNRRGHQWGLAVFSRFPLEKKMFIPFKSNKEANTNGLQIIKTSLKNDQEAYLFNYHLESYKLGSRFKLDVNKNYRNPKWWLQNIKPITLHMIPAMKEKIKQATLISNEINQINLPIIAAGDMNDIPGSSTYLQIHKNLYDTALSGNQFFPYTIRSFPPFFRIDYISTSNDWEILDYQIHKIEYSDHYPILSILQLK